MTLTAVIFICAMVVPRSECGEHTAVRWIEHPTTTQLMVECYTQSMITAASIRKMFDDSYYLKIGCRRGTDL